MTIGKVTNDSDSWLFLEKNDIKILNLNDCVFEEEELERLSKYTGKVDILLTQFSFANWIGNKNDHNAMKASAERKLSDIERHISYFSPKYTIPIASYVWFCHEDNFHFNEFANKINWQIGLRMEQVWNTTTSELLQTNRGNDYFNLFPSAKIKRTHGDASTSALSYGRRINRPGLGQLNPFIDITDSLNQYGGNPALVPELVDAIELAHDRSVRKGDLGLRAFYRRARNSIQTFTVLDSNGVAFSRPENFGAMHTAGGELLLAFPVTRFCNVNLSASLYQQWLDDPLLENELLAWYGKAIVAIVPWKSAKLQVAANYTAPVLLPQGKVEAVYFVDAGFTQSFANGRGRIGITEN